jgi:glycosyltransferase involved in cell wall biosynthesis
MSTATPDVSVVIPIHNAARYLRDAVDSILNQQDVSLELILVDDGSTDGSSDILEQYGKRDPRVRVFRPGRIGICNALNFAIRQSRSEWIARMDADDIALPYRLSTELRYLARNPECVAVGSGALQIDPNGYPISDVCLKSSHDDIVDELLSGRGSAMIHPTVIMRKSSALDVGGYDPEYARTEDLDLFLKLSEVGRLANLPDVLLLFRRHPNSYSVFATNSETLPIKTKIVNDALRRRGRRSTQSLIDCYRPGTLAELYLTWVLSAYWSGHWQTVRRYLVRLPLAMLRQPSSIYGTAAVIGHHLWSSLRQTVKQRMTWFTFRTPDENHVRSDRFA